MTQKVMLEVTQDVVVGNEVVVAAGTLLEADATLQEGVSVRPVMADVPDKAAEAEAARPGVAEADQSPSRGGSAKGAAKS